MSAAVVDRNVSIPQAAGVIAFNADWNSKQRSTSSNIKITEPNTNEVAAKATANLPTTFLSILGITSVPIDVNATVAIGHNKAEVALALDVTGSMSGTKITDLKTAAKLLIDTAYTPAGSDQKVKFSLVPVSSYVNVGLTYRNASWMSVPADSSSTTNIYSTVPPVATISNCTTKTATAYNDGVPYTDTYEDSTYTYGPPTTLCSDVTATTTTWTGCAGARTYPKNIQKTADNSSPIPGVMNTWCSTPLVRLTNVQTDIKSAIDGLTATGNTYSPSGLTWGWRTLSSTAPLADGGTNTTSTRKVLVLMTDGAYTLSPTYPAHDGTVSTTSDNLMSELYNSIKAENISIYAIAFGITDNNIKDRLKSCATTKMHYFDATSAVELTAAFEKIGRQLTALHIKH